jgi:hypothetical protein
LPVAPVADAEAPVDAVAKKDATPSKDGSASPDAGELEGWVAWNDYDPKCRFQVPSDRKYLPEPFEWEPCQDTEITRKMACRRIKKKWAGIPGEFIGPATSMTTLNDGSLAIGTVRYHGNHQTYLYAEVDGRTKVAVDLPATGECLVTDWSASGSRYAFQVAERNAQGKLTGGPSAIGGSLDELGPRELLRESSELEHSLTAGNVGLIDLAGTIRVFSWEYPPTLSRTIQGGGSYSFARTRDDFFWFSSDAPAPTERIWTPEGGEQLFAGDASDRSRGTADLATDGKDWVWSEAEGRTNAGYPIVKMVTAPFTRDPKLIQKRVLRNDMGSYGFGARPHTVGFGYAGHSGSRNSDAILGAMIVRIADGAAWFIPGRGAGVIEFQSVLAISKDEAFLRVRDENGTNLYRVRLDSLGAFALPAAPN